MPTPTRLRVISLFLAAALVLCAQDRNASQPELVPALLARIDKLGKRVSELESRTGAAPEAKTAVAETPIAAHDHETSGGALSSPNLRIAGFSDINFSATDPRGVRSGFSEGQFILHLSSSLGPRVSYFSELSLAARTDGIGSPPAPGFNFEVERSIIRFDQSDKLKLSFGCYHTPINYWNTAFHHGSWLQIAE